MELQLSVPDMRFFQSYINALEEGFAYGSGDPHSTEEIAEIKTDAEKHLASLKVTFKEGTFTAKDGTTWPRVYQEKIWVTLSDEFIGAINFRPIIHEQLAKYAGHVAYSTKPSARRKNYASCALALLIADKDRIQKVDRDHLVITADPDNYASQKVITKNGGHFVTEEFFSPMNEMVRIYNIPLVRS